MRTTLPLSVAAATLMALSCSSGGPTICEGSDAIPQQTVKVDEDLRVAAVCFEDPAGGELNYSGTSADASIAEAFGRGTAVWIRGVSPGQTSVTARATNESDQSSESVEFQVLVTNQAPEFTDSITADAVGVGRFGRWRLHSLFVEPDGDSMTFTATSSFPGLAVALTDSFVNFAGTSGGQAQVTLTATDSHGEEGSGTISVDVWTPEVVFVDEFDTDASLDDWEPSQHTELTILDGALEVRSVNDSFFGIAERSGDNVDEFILDFTTRTETGPTGVIWFVSDTEVYRVLLGSFADDNNWLFHRWRGGTEGWGDAVGAGNSSLIALDRYRQYSIVMYDVAMQLLADGQVVETVIFSDFEANRTMRTLWLIGTTDGTVYDRAQLGGRPGSTSDHDIADGDPKRELPDERMLKLLSLPEYH